MYNYYVAKNEVERFDKLEENYGGNLPERIVHEIDTLDGFFKSFKVIKNGKRLDYGSFGLSIKTIDLLKKLDDYLKKLESEENINKYLIKHVATMYNKVYEIQDEYVMIVCWI